MCTILCFWATKLRIIFDIPMYNAKKVIVSSLQASLGAELTTSARLYLQWIDAVGLFRMCTTLVARMTLRSQLS